MYILHCISHHNWWGHKVISCLKNAFWFILPQNSLRYHLMYHTILTIYHIRLYYHNITCNWHSWSNKVSLVCKHIWLVWLKDILPGHHPSNLCSPAAQIYPPPTKNTFLTWGLGEKSRGRCPGGRCLEGLIWGEMSGEECPITI